MNFMMAATDAKEVAVKTAADNFKFYYYYYYLNYDDI